MKHVVSAKSHFLWTVMELSIQVSVTLLSQQVAAQIQVVVVLSESQRAVKGSDLFRTQEPVFKSSSVMYKV